ncbi:HNH endonuclease [Streptomyces sp. NPDC092295]
MELDLTGMAQTVDHIWPQWQGGPGSPWNGKILCRACNRAKSDTWPWP